MASTVNGADKLFVSFPILKFESNDDGDLVVYGKATDGSVDSDEQIVDPKWSGPALQKWLDTGGNVRVQHNPSLYPAGKGLTVEETSDGHYVKALVVEPTAKKLVKAGVLQAYSVGISRPVVERDITGKARGGIIKGGELFELSLVDRPANKNCSITLSKSEGELVKSEDGDDQTEWTTGDLEGALSATEITKAPSGEELATAYKAARSEWLAAEPDPTQATQGPEYLAKRAEWQRWHAEGESAGLTEGGHQLWLTKRQMDPNVGGGTDRDKIPASDFAGRNRSFPIVKPGDVSDAASSIGRAGPDNYSSDKLKENIIRIANRKGPSFVSALPASWTDAKKAKKKKPSFMIGVNQGGKTDEIPVAKGDGYTSDKCPVCGYDVKDNGQCGCCNAYPCTCDPGEMANKAGGCYTCGSDVSNGMCTGCDKPANDCTCKAAAKKGKKNGRKKKPFMEGEGSAAGFGEGGTTMKGGMITKCVCGSCGSDMDDDDLFCSQCGTAAVAGGMGEGGMGAGPVDDKSLMPTRATKTKNPAGGLKPAGPHREPDGDTSVEQLEQDAGMPTKKDPKKDKVPSSVDAKAKKSERPVDYALKRMHDALCAAYHSDEVLAEYPSLKSVTDAVDPAWFKDESVAEEAVQLKGADPALVADARAELHKMFMDSYPTLRLKPGAPPKPGSFQRPYISTGHAPLTATGKKPKMPAGARSLNPNSFDRGPITAGHERNSPASKSGNNPTGDVSTGSARGLYGAASRAYEANRMKAIHDHIERTTTGLCPMAPSASVMPPRNGADAMPAPRPALNTAAGAVASTKSADETPGLDLVALQELIDSRVAEATKSIKKKYKNQISDLRSELDELGRQPDPTQAPVRGTVRKTAASGAVPVDRRSLAIEAQDRAANVEKAAYVEYLRNLTASGNPEVREKAYKALTAEGVPDAFSS